MFAIHSYVAFLGFSLALWMRGATHTVGQELRHKSLINESHQSTQTLLIRSPQEMQADETKHSQIDNDLKLLDLPVSANNSSIRLQRRVRRDNSLERNPDDGRDVGGSNFEADEVGWSNINEEVDIVIPLVLYHLRKLGIEHLVLPNLKESISVKPLFITYTAGLWLHNGLVYNVAGIQRSGDAMMTYKDKSFLCRFYLHIRSLQFDYDFQIKLMTIEGYGKVVGSLDDTLIYADLSVNVEDTRLRLNDFRIVKFSNIQVQLNHRRLIRELTGAILSPITNLFRERITTSISDGLKDQMQTVMDDFNDKDPLELRKFTKQILSSLTGQAKN